MLEIEAVMPDGLVVYHTPAIEGTLEVDLTPLTDDMAQKPVTVYLVVPAKKEGQDAARGRWPGTKVWRASRLLMRIPGNPNCPFRAWFRA